MVSCLFLFETLFYLLVFVTKSPRVRLPLIFTPPTRSPNVVIPHSFFVCFPFSPQFDFCLVLVLPRDPIERAEKPIQTQSKPRQRICPCLQYPNPGPLNTTNIHPILPVHSIPLAHSIPPMSTPTSRSTRAKPSQSFNWLFFDSANK